MSTEPTAAPTADWPAFTPDAELEALLGAPLAPEAEEEDSLWGTVQRGRITQANPEGVEVTLPSDVVVHVATDEIGLPGDTATPAVGDNVAVLMDRPRTDGSWVGSISRARCLEANTALQTQVKARARVSGIIRYPVRGGFAIEVAGMRGFLPGRESGIRLSEAFAATGRSLDVELVRWEADQSRVLVTRGRLDEAEAQQRKEAAMAAVVEGSVVEGTIVSIRPFGAFVDLGGVQGLAHISELSLSSIDDPSEAVEVGERLSFRVLSVEPRKGRISLSRRDLLSEGLSDRIGAYAVGQTVSGKVLRMTDRGAFVELEPGIVALLRTSELSWTGRPHPEEVLAVDQTIETKIISVEADQNRIALSLRRLQADPWGELEEATPVDSVVEGTIRRIEDYGLFVELPQGLVGLCHISDLVWTGRPKSPTEVHPYALGDTITVRVLEIDAERQKLKLGVKQLQPDPWDAAGDKLKTGAIFDATVTRLEESAAWLEIVEGLEGRLYIAEISEERVDSIRSALRIGQVVTVTPVQLDRSRRRIDLSMKAVTVLEQVDVPRTHQEELGGGALAAAFAARSADDE